MKSLIVLFATLLSVQTVSASAISITKPCPLPDSKSEKHMLMTEGVEFVYENDQNTKKMSHCLARFVVRENQGKLTEAKDFLSVVIAATWKAEANEIDNGGMQ